MVQLPRGWFYVACLFRTDLWTCFRSGAEMHRGTLCIEMTLDTAEKRYVKTWE